MNTSFLKKSLAILTLSLGLFFSISSANLAIAQESPEIFFFGRDDCQFCQSEKEFFDELSKERDFKLTYFDVYEENGKDVFNKITEIKKATSINAIAPDIIAHEAKKIGALLVHYSTDYVFDGKKQTPSYDQKDHNYHVDGDTIRRLYSPIPPLLCYQ